MQYKFVDLYSLEETFLIARGTKKSGPIKTDRSRKYSVNLLAHLIYQRAIF